MSVPLATCKVKEIHENIRKHNRHIHELENIQRQGGGERSRSASESENSLPSSPGPERKMPDREGASPPVILDGLRHLRHVRDSLFEGIFGTNRSRSASLPSAKLHVDVEKDDESLVKKMESFGPNNSGRSLSLPHTRIEEQNSSNSSDSQKRTSQLDP